MSIDTHRARYCEAAASFEAALLRFHKLTLKFAADQPRVPAGSPDGGQWTSGGDVPVVNPTLLAGTDMYGAPWGCAFVSTNVLRCRDGFGNPDYDIDYSGHGGVHFHRWEWKGGQFRRGKAERF